MNRREGVRLYQAQVRPSLFLLLLPPGHFHFDLKNKIVVTFAIATNSGFYFTYHLCPLLRDPQKESGLPDPTVLTISGRASKPDSHGLQLLLAQPGIQIGPWL